MSGPRNATTTSKGRTYRWRDETFDSVTSIIGGGVPKPALTNWAAKSVAEWTVKHLEQVNIVAKDDPAAAIDLMKGSPNRQRDAAAVKGSDIHAAAEAHVNGLPQPKWAADVAPTMAQFLRFLDDFKPTFEMTEVTVFSRRHQYAGTLDWIASFGDRLILGDNKTGKGVYPEVGLQLAAYRYADFIGMPDGQEILMPEVDGCMVLHLRPQSYTLIPVVADETIHRTFLYAQQIHRFCKDTSSGVLLAPLSPGEELVTS